MPRKQLAQTLTRMNPAATHADLGALLEEIIAKVNEVVTAHNTHVSTTSHASATAIVIMNTSAQREIYP
jgi:hypothetical protein